MFATSLHHCLTQELQHLQALAALLDDEATALLQRATPQVLAQLAQQKLEEFQHLSDLSRERDQLLHEAGLDAGHTGTEAAVAQHPLLAATWHELLQVAEAAKQQNERNGLYIQTQLTFTTESLAALRDAQARTTLYGPKGRQTPSQPNAPTRSHKA